MASYKIVWKASSVRDLKRIDQQHTSKILKAIELLSTNPLPNKCRKIQGSESSFRIRIGDYRVVYQVDANTRMVTLYYVRHRRDAYKK